MPDIEQSRKRTVDRMMVRIEHLDTLLGLAGEVIITSSAIHELQRSINDLFTRNGKLSKEHLDTIQASDEAARRISQDLHDLVMAIRLVEIGETMRLFRRPIRDLARNLGREVELVMKGEEVMIDKALAERLVDPILHLLRNAIDHGIEPPLERTRLDKPSSATVTVSAEDLESSTRITVQDDGRGIDPEAVYAKATSMGLCAEGERPPVLRLLCSPGFSTSGEVTSTSGRGVGLDLVQNVVEEFGGEFTYESTPDVGTTFTLTIPKLRAVNIVDALTVRAGNRLFAFSIDQIVSSMGVPKDQVRTAMGGDRFIEYLGEVIVLRDLQELLGDAPSEISGDLLPVVIVESKTDRLALIVGEFLGPQKLVNVPLDHSAFQVRGISGTSIFSGGRIGLTLDIDELILMSLGVQEDHFHYQSSGVFAEAPDAVTDTAPKPQAKAIPQAAAGELVNLPESDMADLLDELRRGLSTLQDALLSLEAKPGESGLLNEAFRRLHAAKGNLTMLGAESAASLAHGLETVLDFMRSERLQITPERMDLLLDGVAVLSKDAEAMPGVVPAPHDELLAALNAEVDTSVQDVVVESSGDLIGRSFKLSPTIELQIVSALKRKENTLETFLTFTPGRQADFLVSYLILRRLGQFGTVLATLPPVDEIEKGHCGAALKVLWTTPLDEDDVISRLEVMAGQYSLTEYHSVPTSIFRYEAQAE